MNELKKHTARFVAAQVLGQFDPNRDYASAILDKFLDGTDQRQRATDLVFGTLRNLAAIDSVINSFSGCLVKRIQRKLINIVRIGCYEIIYTPSTAEHSIVNEAAQVAKAIAGQKQVGFINALLREILRHVANRQISLSQVNNKRTLPQNMETGCEFDSEFLPDIENNRAEYLSTAFSLPGWLIGDWLKEFGDSGTYDICAACNRRPSVYIRPNTLKTTSETLIRKFRENNIELEEVPNEANLLLKSPSDVSRLPGFDEGLFIVQDLTASLPVKQLKPRREWKILDMCAAPGGKATQMAEATGDSASIIATDIDSQRLLKVKENIDRLGIKSVEIRDYAHIDGMDFDCIMLDVPCSNTGVLAKRIEMRFRLKPDSITKFAKTQRELLEKASTMIKPYGAICYSTCSIQKQENKNIIQDFLASHANFSAVSEQLVLPSASKFDHDGGYATVLVRES